MNMPNKNFLTEHREHLLFYSHYTERRYDFPYNDDLIDAIRSIRTNQTSAVNKKFDSDNFHYGNKTLGGFQPVFPTDFTEITKEHAPYLQDKHFNAIKSLKENIIIDTVNDHLTRFYPAITQELIYVNWAIIYDKNSFQRIHTHGNTLFTSIFYVDMPKTKYPYEGQLEITDTSSNFNGLATRVIEPIKGLMITFPGKYPHYTLPIQSEGERIVIVNDVRMSNNNNLEL
jgi:hypothetical protein